MFKDIIKNPCAKVVAVPTLSDNYAYLLIDPVTKNGLCVDPAEPKKVIDAAKDEGVLLKSALCTHKHWDHSGGNREIKKLIPEIEIVGSAYEQIPAVTKSVQDGDVIPFGSLEIKCIKASCHTIGQIMYFVHSPTNPDLQPILFTGDTIFIAGCGRFFEGSAKMMLEIMQKLEVLPPETLIYCGHEYTVNNLKFAQTVDESPEVTEKLKWAQDTRKQGLPTVPSTLKQERTYNPFMRTSHLQSVMGQDSIESTMKKLRDLKDRF
ncbi:hydroxyacylglutathione hydrolase, putative [Theileria equi strain WA]|uniref:hydroxyacylglutathione hydrolase n=1 Tax=Theileria equi strain WA TaxID=1537102 RepID=L0AYH7_THEEQ|nr:hydroxyacylglutathione hydrolase, putative [Theileria equi strain WA]AFZ80308.1 hydroxyacylglutathione hydrolase, putative [Theileria equi strain WA]|eukprot:XP_004829974.1 hydroxyacylglutathione hydrolase, putative [Theileria equi strain WA]